MGALNLPSAADIERVTRRLRSLSQRLEGIEDAIDRLEERVAVPAAAAAAGGDDRLGRIESRLDEITRDIAALAELLAPAARADAACAGAAHRHRPRRVAGLADPHAELRQLVRAMRRAPFDRAMSLTPSTQAAATPRRAAIWRIVAASISTATAPRSTHERGRLGARVVEEVAARDRDRPRAGLDEPREQLGIGPSTSSAPSAALVPSAGSTTSAASRSPSASSRSSAPQVPMRTSFVAPRAISSATIAALGPPMPVAWTVRSSPSAAVPV